VGQRPAFAGFVERHAPVVCADIDWAEWSKQEGSFLTVIVRTQGNRLESLEEALLCLAAQTCQDFEVLVAVHDSEDDKYSQVEGLAREFGEISGREIRVVSVRGGTRARPIAVGIEMATTRYAAMLDDDDYVTADWVETYRHLEDRAPGRVLRVLAASREMIVATGALGATRVCSSATEVDFGERWSMAAHVGVNSTPNSAFAFPLFPFRHLGTRLNEELEVVEDWDLLLTLAALCGVEDEPIPTVIYNQHHRDSSLVHVDDSSWRKAEKKVKERHQLVLCESTELVDLLARLQESRARVERLEQEHQDLIVEYHDTLARLGEAGHQLDLVSKSRAWRIVTFLRKTKRLGRREIAAE
jgi:glycosyltransferase involved in cell wall biosynthesis